MASIHKDILNCSEPLFALTRRGIPEVVIQGVGYVKVESKSIQGNHPEATIIMRSLLKPWQFLSADVGGEESFWSLGLASHSGQPLHLEELGKLCAVAEAGEDELFCPRCYPLDSEISVELRHSGKKPSRLYHPCAGKHLVAIAACRAHNYSVESYWDPEHPLQKRLYNLIGREVGEKPIWMIDSCGLPTVAITAKAALGMWERLILNSDARVEKMRQLWVRNPFLVGGQDRLDSNLMAVFSGSLLAKEGADGLLAIAALPEHGNPGAVCLVKLASGYNTSYLALGLWSVLSRAQNLPPVFQGVLDYLKSRLEKWTPSDQKLVLPPFESL